jgi:hypothetical protein
MIEPDIRKLAIHSEEVLHEVGRPVAPPLRKVVAAAVIRNPHAGRYVEDLAALVEIGEFLGGYLGTRAVAMLGSAVHSYGKAAIVGTAGELEHAAAILHPRLGKPLRNAVGQGAAIIPSAKKRGGPGTTVDIPLHFKDDEWSFDHFDAATISVCDAPMADEILVAIAVSNRGRPLARTVRGS